MENVRSAISTNVNDTGTLSIYNADNQKEEIVGEYDAEMREA